MTERKENTEKQGLKIMLEDESDDDDEYIPWLDLLKALREALEYKQGKKPTRVTKYVDGIRADTQWQMVDGTKVEVPK